MEEVVEVLLYSLMISGLSMFIQECYKPQMILHRYYEWIGSLYDKKPRKIYSVLALCVYCQSFWINTLLYPLFFPIDEMFLLSIGGVYIGIEIILKINR